MRTLHHVNEFKQEAGQAVFNKQQAISVTMQLLLKEQADPANTGAEATALAEAVRKAEFRYIDETRSQTDQMLDELGVARFTVEDIVRAIGMLIFDVS